LKCWTISTVLPLFKRGERGETVFLLKYTFIYPVDISVTGCFRDRWICCLFEHFFHRTKHKTSWAVQCTGHCDV